MVLNDKFKWANRRANGLQVGLPSAISAHYDYRSDHIMIRLSSNLILSFSPRDAQDLEHARAS